MAVGIPLATVRVFGYAVNGSAKLVDGQEVMKPDAIVKTAFGESGVPKTLAMGISPLAARVAD